MGNKANIEQEKNSASTGQKLQFIHLRAHSSYSLSEGAIKPENIAPLCTKHEMPAIGLSDSGNLFGLLEISLSCAKEGVQLIPAVEANLAYDREKGINHAGKVVLIAKDEQGYKNLLKLVSYGFINSEDHTFPIITIDELQESSQGIICLTGGCNGFIDTKIRDGQKDFAEESLLKLKELFNDRLYIELNRLGQSKQVETEKVLIDFAKEHKLPLVATNNVMFSEPTMYEAQDILMCIAQGAIYEDANRVKYGEQNYFRSQEEMSALFSDIPEALENTINIAKRCSYIAHGEAPMLPNFPTEGGRSDTEEFAEVALQGLCKRLAISEKPSDEDKEKYKDYFERLDYEVGIISEMKFPGYFLIVSDFIRWAKQNNIPVGPGRGSGAGSVVAWAMEITNLDPLRFGLLFERFLNPERVSMPDFDIDFCQERRGEVITYVQDKYGHENVAQIITFGKLQARAVLRDVGRVLQIPYSKVDRICKIIPFNPIDPVTLEKAVAMDRDLKAEMASDEVIARLIDIGLKLEGMHRHASTHAAGVVIGPKPLVEILPLYTDHRSNMPITQYSMKYSETAGLVKFDFLGLKTLTLISKACEMIKQNEGVELDMDNMPFDDKKSFEILAQGKGTGVFQMESAGMRDSMRKMKIDSIEDIIALISLYRPGPMENIPTYIARKLGKEKPDYLHPMLEECLKETYGVIIYQEQVMQIAQIMGGYTLGGADLLRRAMGKKIIAEMDAQRALFVDGAVANEVPKKKAEEIFDLVAKFAGYGFNKSHAAAYAAIGYQTAYLKAHYPAEFLCACMNQIIGDTDKLLVFREESRRMDIEILPPNINKSDAHFIVEKNSQTGVKAIRYAFGALKNVGIEAMEQLVEERAKNGDFKDLDDFIARVDRSVMNKRQIESLAQCGAFDDVHYSRRQIFEQATSVVRFNQSIQEEKNDDQSSLFGGDAEVEIRKIRLTEYEEWDEDTKILNEFASIGFFLNNHPVINYKPLLPQNIFTDVEQLDEKVPIKEIARGSREKGSKYLMIGAPNKVVHRTSNGRRFSYFYLSDPTGMTEVNIFNEELINRTRDILETGKVVVVNVEARRDEGGIRLIADDIIEIDEYLSKIETKAEITVKEENFNSDFMDKLKAAAVNDNRGEGGDEVDSSRNPEFASANSNSQNSAKAVRLKINLETKNGFLVQIRLPENLNISAKQLQNLNFEGIESLEITNR